MKSFIQVLACLFMIFCFIAIVQEKNNHNIAYASAATVIDLPKPQVNQEQLECLTKDIFFEARGQDYKEKQMDANVVMNRKNAFGFPEKICDIVYDDWQFSWTNENHNLKRILTNLKEYAAWQESERIAFLALTGQLKDLTGGALFYHAKYVRPAWNYRKLRITARSEYSVYYTRKSKN